MSKKKTKKDLINLEDNQEEKEITTSKLKETKKNEIKKDNQEEIKESKNKLNIFFLIICLLLLTFLIINFFLNKNYNLNEIIKTGSFFLILLIIIILLFKVNNKKTTPYIILITLILIGYTIFQTSYSIPNDLYVKDFINKDISEVIEFTNKNSLKLVTLHEYSDTVLKNHIIMQEYGIDTLIKDIKTFKVTISDGPNYDKEVIVSNLTGCKYDEVIKYIKDNYLVNVEIEFIKSDKLRDTVIEQIGSGSLKRNSLIKFIFSLGNEELDKISVKDLKGLSLFEATSYLKRYNINYELVYEYSDKYEKNYIISQDIVDKVVEDKLILKVSKGKEIKVPDLKKMSNIEITEWALKNNIKIEYKEVYNKETNSGTILEVSASKDDIIDEDSKLIITISKGSLVMPKINDLTEFKLWANNNNINYEEVYEFNDTIKEGELIKTNIQEGEKIIETDTIILTISKGKSVSVPNFVGQSKTSIQATCQKANLTCTFTYGGLTEATKKDISIKQSKPVGTVVSSKTNVLITLSSGIYEKVNVPSFINKTKTEIQNSCNSLGIKCNFTYNNTYSSVAKDTCISQDKTGVMIKGSTVNITLSIGPAKTYTFVIDGSLLTLGNPEQTKKTLQTKLQNNYPGVNFNFSFKAVNSGIGLLHPDSQIKVGQNTVVQGKTYNVIIQSSN